MNEQVTEYEMGMDQGPPAQISVVLGFCVFVPRLDMPPSMFLGNTFGR